MITEGKKVIGVFLNASDIYFTGILYNTFRQHARMMNTDLVFFSSVDYKLRRQEDFDPQERELFRFAPIEDLDGIILVPDSYEVSKNREALEEEIRRRAKAPVVSVRSQNDLGDCVFMDERIAIRPLVKHLIEEHGIRRFAYLAGAPGHLPTRQREEAFRPMGWRLTSGTSCGGTCGIPPGRGLIPTFLKSWRNLRKPLSARMTTWPGA